MLFSKDTMRNLYLFISVYKNVTHNIIRNLTPCYQVKKTPEMLLSVSFIRCQRTYKTQIYSARFERQNLREVVFPFQN